MYDRAPRVLTGTTGSTSGDVGPGKYEPDTKRPIDGKRLHCPSLALRWLTEGRVSYVIESVLMFLEYYNIW